MIHTFRLLANKLAVGEIFELCCFGAHVSWLAA